MTARRSTLSTLALLALALPTAARAQDLLLLNPLDAAYAGPTSARGESVWSLRSNPASLSTTETRLGVSGSPTAPGIGLIGEGTVAASFPLSPTVGAGATAEYTAAGAYSRTSISALGAVDLGGVTLGLGATYHSISIDNYGSAGSVTFDLGARAKVTEKITVGGAFRNVARATLADESLPQRLNVGFGFDLGGNTLLSIDAVQELGRSGGATLALSSEIVEGLTLRGGGGIGPGTLALGLGYRLSSVTIDLGGAYVGPIGVRSALGASVRL